MKYTLSARERVTTADPRNAFSVLMQIVLTFRSSIYEPVRNNKQLLFNDVVY